MAAESNNRTDRYISPNIQYAGKPHDLTVKCARRTVVRRPLRLAHRDPVYNPADTHVGIAGPARGSRPRRQLGASPWSIYE